MKKETTQHTPEPWEIHPVENTIFVYTIIDGKAPEICRTPTNTPTDMSNVRRIVAAVNACAGLTTESLETGVLIAGQLSKLEALKKAHSKGNLARLISERMDAQDEADRLKKERDDVIIDKMALMMERDQLRAENERMIAALKKITLMARTSGGTAGVDTELMAACSIAEKVLHDTMSAIDEDAENEANGELPLTDDKEEKIKNFFAMLNQYGVTDVLCVQPPAGYDVKANIEENGELSMLDSRDGKRKKVKI